MQIVQIIPKLAAGGAERTTLDVSRAIVQAGGKSLVLAKGGRLVHELVRDGGQFQALPVHSKNLFVMRKNVHAIADHTKEFGGQILHARSRAPAWSTRAAARKLGLPFVTTYHGTYNSGSAIKTFYNSVMAAGDLVIANSKFVATHIQQIHKTPPERIRVIPRGIDMAALDPANINPVRREQIFSKIGFEGSPEVPMIVMPGRLTRWKGQLVMIEAMAGLRDAGIQAQLVLPGDTQGRDKYHAELIKSINQHDLAHSISLPGHLADMAALYAMSDIVVSASTEPEAFGRVAVEGQAAGCPVIATAHGGSLETLQDGIGGTLVTPGSASDLAEALAEILALDMAHRQQMGQAGRKWVQSQFSREKMCAATMAVYVELLAS